MSNWGQVYYDHFSSFFGSPTRVIPFASGSDKFSIQILTYDNVFDGCRGFCSLGLTHHQEKVGGLVEVFLASDDGWEDIPYVLAELLHYMTAKSLLVARGSSVDGVENVLPSFADTFSKSAIYFTDPFGLPTNFGVVTAATGAGRVYLATFITQSEYRFLREEGPEQFERLLESEQVDIFRLGRESSI